MSRRTLVRIVLVGVAIAALVYAFVASQAPERKNGLVRVEIPVKGQKNIVVAVDREGKMTWNGEPVTCEEMQARFRKLQGKPDTKAALAQDKKRCAEERQ